MGGKSTILSVLNCGSVPIPKTAEFFELQIRSCSHVGFFFPCLHYTRLILLSSLERPPPFFFSVYVDLAQGLRLYMGISNYSAGSSLYLQVQGNLVTSKEKMAFSRV